MLDKTIIIVAKLDYTYFIIFVWVALSGCATTAQITSVAEKNEQGNILIKWEVNPDQDGDINIYSSSSDVSPDNFTPIKTTSISDQVTEISISSPDVRNYFILKTNSAYSGIVSNRIIEMSKVKNFRDLGGYFTKNYKQMKWGKIFRSGDLSSATLYDQERIRRLGIKTIVDFRSEKSCTKYPILVHPSIHKIALSVVLMDLETMTQQIEDENLTRSKAISYVQNSYVGIVENNKKEYAEMFNLLTDEDNYPILLVGSLGKDRVGLASFLILYALSIPEAVVLEDYMLSGKLIDISKVIEDAHTMPEHVQEAITAMLSVNEAYLNFAIEHIITKYGSVDRYLEKELGLTSEKKKKLNQILLY